MPCQDEVALLQSKTCAPSSGRKTWISVMLSGQALQLQSGGRAAHIDTSRARVDDGLVS